MKSFIETLNLAAIFAVVLLLIIAIAGAMSPEPPNSSQVECKDCSAFGPSNYSGNFSQVSVQIAIANELWNERNEN
jgi:hypothetical protein